MKTSQIIYEKIAPEFFNDILTLPKFEGLRKILAQQDKSKIKSKISYDVDCWWTKNKSLFGEERNFSGDSASISRISFGYYKNFPDYAWPVEVKETQSTLSKLSCFALVLDIDSIINEHLYDGSYFFPHSTTHFLFLPDNGNFELYKSYEDYLNFIKLLNI